jgi:hypothetical protein
MPSPQHFDLIPLQEISSKYTIHQNQITTWKKQGKLILLVQAQVASSPRPTLL